MGRTSHAKEHLLDAALELTWERSYGVVTIDAICEKAGVKKGSFYYFFASKSELASAALDYNWFSHSKQKWDEIFSASTSPLDRIKQFFRFTYEAQEKLRVEHGKVLGCSCFNIGSEISTQDETIRAKTQEILQRQIRYFETAIGDAQVEGSIPPGDAASQAKCLFALYEGSLGQARIQNDLEFLGNLPTTSMQVLRAKQLEVSE